jgi:hypothetical protein
VSIQAHFLNRYKLGNCGNLSWKRNNAFQQYIEVWQQTHETYQRQFTSDLENTVRIWILYRKLTAHTDLDPVPKTYSPYRSGCCTENLQPIPIWVLYRKLTAQTDLGPVPKTYSPYRSGSCTENLQPMPIWVLWVCCSVVSPCSATDCVTNLTIRVCLSVRSNITTDDVQSCLLGCTAV